MQENVENVRGWLQQFALALEPRLLAAAFLSGVPT
jgi:hypothetical protein